ncbi:MAG: GntR family transcriptional regulator [Chitinophagaceae bacterium]
MKILLSDDSKTTKFQQIVDAIAQNIEKGILAKDTLLPSINSFSKNHNVARDTIDKAYKKLKTQGYVVSVAGRGYYVAGKKDSRQKILLLFNKLSTYKKAIYDSFVTTIGKKAKIDLEIFNYDPESFKEIIEANIGRYNYYVVIPIFFNTVPDRNIHNLLKLIPASELIVLDKKMPGLKSRHTEIYQDFKNDIYSVFTKDAALFNKYKNISIILNKSNNHPLESIDGVRIFCTENSKRFSVVDNFDELKLHANTVYIVTTDWELAQLIKRIRSSKYVLGETIGIISYNETILKELLDITVVTTDFEIMGRTAAECLLSKEIKKINNPFSLIRRKSL